MPKRKQLTILNVCIVRIQELIMQFLNLAIYLSLTFGLKFVVVKFHGVSELTIPCLI